MQPISATTSTGNPERRWYPRRVIAATFVVVFVAVGFYLLYLFSNVLFVLFVSAVLATAIRPAVIWLERFHIPQPLGVLLIYLLTVLAAIGIAALLLPLLIAQVSTIANDLPGYYSQFREWLASLPSSRLRSLAFRLPEELSLSTRLASPQQEQVVAVTQAVGYVRTAGWSLFGGVAITLITFFWIVDREQIVRAGLLIVPIDRRPLAQELWDTLEEKVGAFVRGQALLCLSIGILSAIAFFAIGLPNALLLSVLAAILEAIPYIGPIATTLLAVTLTLAQSPEKVWLVLGACIVIQQIENALLVPRIMDRTVGVNAVVTLLAIAAFGTLLGIGGAIMAIPLAVIIQVLVERLVFDAQQSSPQEIAGRDQVAVLRYQAQDLAADLRDRMRGHDVSHEHLLEEDLEAVVGDIDLLLQALKQPGPDDAVEQPT